MSKPVLFLAFANDRVEPGGFLRSLNQELKQLKDTLLDEQGLRERGEPRWTVHDVADTTIDDLVRGLQRYRDHIAVFHYGGHAGDYELLLQSATGERAVANAGGLARLLGGQRGLQLVFLNGCSTYGHVAELLAAGVPAVIATRRPVEDALALDFARHFHGGLATGASLGRAFAEALEGVRTAIGGGERPGPATRGFEIGEAPAIGASPAIEDRLPWELHVRPGAEAVREWNLGAAAGDPLFGLPPLEPRDLPPSPYRHLRWYTRDDAELFFGRGAEIHTLYESVTSTAAAPVVLLYGQSGSGKSSLLDAGVRPRLEATHDVRYVRRDDRLGLTGTLRQALDSEAGQPLGGPSLGGPSLGGASLGGAWHALEARLGRPVVAILDQVEEVFSRPRPEMPNELEDFVAELAAAFGDPLARPRGRLVLGFRKEWLAELTKRLGDAYLPYHEVFLDRLGRDGVVEAVTGPTRVKRLRDKYQLRIVDETELATIIADDLLADRASSVAPTLQVLLSKLWAHPDARRGGTVVFDKALYQQLKDDGILLKDFFDEQLKKLEAWRPTLVSSGLALDLLHAHTTEMVTARVQAAPRLAKEYEHHAAVLTTVVDQCRDRYLLVDAAQAPNAQLPNAQAPDTQTPNADRRATTLAHDTLAPLVRSQFETSDRPGQRARRLLEARAAEWADGRTGRTLDEIDLATVEEGKPGMRAWQPDEERLVVASRIACAQAVKERRRRKILRNTAVVAIAVLFVVASVMAYTAETALRRAQGLTLASAAAAEEDPLDGALLLARLDGATVPPSGLQTVIDVARHTLPMALIAAHDEAVYDVSFSPDSASTQVLSGGEDYRVVVSNADGTGTPRQVGVHTGSAFSARFSPDGRMIVTASMDDTVRVWRADGSGVALAIPHPVAAVRALFSPDGALVATLDAESVLRVWRMAAPTRPIAEIRHPASVSTVAFDPEGRRLVTASEDDTARVWRTDGTLAQKIGVGRGGMGAVAFDVGGTAIATGSDDDTVRVVSLATGETFLALGGHRAKIVSVAFSPDAKRLVSTSADGTARIWDPYGSRAPVVLPHTDWVLSAAFSADGERVATGDYRGQVRIWSVAGSDASLPFADGDAAVTATVFTDDGERIVALNSMVRVEVRHPEGRRILDTLALTSGWAPAGAISGDGRLAVTAGDSGVRVWRLTGGGSLVRALDVGTDTIERVAISRDGRRIAAVGTNTALRVWSADWSDSAIVIPQSAPAHSIALSADGSLVAVGGDDFVARVWRVADPAHPRTLFGHRQPVTAVAFGDSGRFVSGSADQNVRVWMLDADTADVDSSRMLVGHHAAITSLAISRDGRWVLSGSLDSTARLWESDSATSVVLRGHTASIASVAISPDGRRVATASYDGTARLWTVRWADLHAHLVRATERVCLPATKLVRLLGMSDGDAEKDAAGCEQRRSAPRSVATRTAPARAQAPPPR